MRVSNTIQRLYEGIDCLRKEIDAGHATGWAAAHEMWFECRKATVTQLQGISQHLCNAALSCPGTAAAGCELGAPALSEPWANWLSAMRRLVS